MICGLLADLLCARWRRVAVAQLLGELAHTFGTAGGVACGGSHFSRSLARLSCRGPRRSWRRSRMSFRRDCLDDDQLSAATWARQREDTGRLVAEAVVIDVILVWRIGSEQLSDPGDIGGPIAIAEEAVVADAVLALWQHMDEEPADELVGLQGHGGVPLGAVDAVIFDAEGDAVCIETDQSAVGNGNAVRVARQIRQHGLGSGEGFLGVDDPIDFAQRLQESVEGRAIDKPGLIAEKTQLPGFVQPGQPFHPE